MEMSKKAEAEGNIQLENGEVGSKLRCESYKDEGLPTYESMFCSLPEENPEEGGDTETNIDEAEEAQVNGNSNNSNNSNTSYRNEEAGLVQSTQETRYSEYPSFLLI